MRKPLLAAVALGLLAVFALGGIASATPRATFTAALVSDVGKFNDKGFNEDQLAGLNRAKAQLGVQVDAIQSNSSADYLPNMVTAVHDGANIISAAGYLLAPTLSQVASEYPNIDFTITDDSVKGPDFAKAKSIKNIEGLVYASNESGCLVGYLAGEMVKAKGGKQVIGAVGGIEIPAVDDYIVGYAHCAALSDPGIKVLVGYSQDFVAQDKCKAVAENQIGQGSQVEFQVAGGCGIGALDAAASAGIWGIGVDVDQYGLAKNVLTSALKRVDVGIFDAIQQAKDGKFQGGSNLLFDLKDNGVGVGKISPKVPAAFVTKMMNLEKQIVAGTVKVPCAKGSDLLGFLPGAYVGPT